MNYEATTGPDGKEAHLSPHMTIFTEGKNLDENLDVLEYLLARILDGSGPENVPASPKPFPDVPLKVFLREEAKAQAERNARLLALTEAITGALFG